MSCSAKLHSYSGSAWAENVSSVTEGGCHCFPGWSRAVSDLVTENRH